VYLRLSRTARDRRAHAAHAGVFSPDALIHGLCGSICQVLGAEFEFLAEEEGAGSVVFTRRAPPGLRAAMARMLYIHLIEVV
jgi:hypothetical protein